MPRATEGLPDMGPTPGRRAVMARAETLLVEGRDPHGFGEVLADLGSALGATRAAIVAAHASADGGVPRMEVRHQWLRTGTARLNPAITGWLPYFPRWARELAAGQPVHGLVVDAPTDERGPLEADGVQAFAAVPVIVADRWYGHLSIDATDGARSWTADDLELLAAVGAMVGRGIELRAADAVAARQAAIRRSAADAARILRAAPEWRAALSGVLELLRHATRSRSAWIYEAAAADAAAAHAARARLVAEVVAPGALPATPRGREVRVDELAMRQLARGEVLAWAGGPDSPPAEPALAHDGSSLAGSLAWLGVASWLLVPVVPHPGVVGAVIGLDGEHPRGWDDGEREALALVASVMEDRLREDASGRVADEAAPDEEIAG